MASTQTQIEGRWQELKGKVKGKWDSVTDQDLEQVEGNLEQLIGLIQRKTGEGREAVEQFVEDTLAQSGSFIEQVADTAREYAGAAGQQVTDAYGKVTDSVQHGYGQAEEYVKQNPTKSLTMAFGGGVLAGLIVGLVLRSR